MSTGELKVTVKGKIRNRVQHLLTKYPRLRDDDHKLIANMWVQDMGGTKKFYALSPEQVMLKMIEGKLTNSRSIVRVRGKLQEEYPSLRGKLYNKRHQIAERVSDEVKTFDQPRGFNET